MENIMTKNMGTTDRVVRTMAAVVIGILMLSGTIGGTLGIVLGALAIIFLATSTVSFCPLYAPFKFSTNKSVIETKKYEGAR
jgi:amino acid transporter